MTKVLKPKDVDRALTLIAAVVAHSGSLDLKKDTVAKAVAIIRQVETWTPPEPLTEQQKRAKQQKAKSRRDRSVAAVRDMLKQ